LALVTVLAKGLASVSGSAWVKESGLALDLESVSESASEMVSRLPSALQVRLETDSTQAALSPSDADSRPQTVSELALESGERATWMP
jgi:hypothetical protein